jgi:acetyl esterase/lipase
VKPLAAAVVALACLAAASPLVACGGGSDSGEATAGGGNGSAADAGRPVVLLFHGGSWLRGGPPAMDIPARIAREVGLAPVKVRYPLGDLRAANLAARRIARRWRGRGRTVVALGESAGGQMAALLAAEGEVDRAVAIAPVSDLMTWWEGGDEDAFWEGELGADEALRRRLSPARRPHENPVLVLHSRRDPVVAAKRSVAYARRYPEVTIRWVGGCHILDCDDSRGPHYHANSRIGLTWLARHTGAG